MSAKYRLLVIFGQKLTHVAVAWSLCNS